MAAIVTSATRAAARSIAWSADRDTRYGLERLIEASCDRRCWLGLRTTGLIRVGIRGTRPEFIEQFIRGDDAVLSRPR
jgi:hypothetical protein